MTASVDSISGFRSHDGFPSRTEYFINGTEPGDDPVHVNLKICKSDGRLATPSDVASGNYDQKEFIILKEDDPTAAKGGPNKWQEGIQNWINTQTDSRYKPPTDFCGTANPVNVDFMNPTDSSSNLSNDFTIKFKADSTNDIVRAELYVDGNNSRNFDGLPFEYAIHLDNGVQHYSCIGKRL